MILPCRIIGYACKTLEIDIIGTVIIPSRDATRTEYKKKIFTHLSFSRFEDAKPLFHDWLENKVKSGVIICEQIVPEAEAFLIRYKIALPTLYYLKREINSVCAHQQETLFYTIYKQLRLPLFKQLDNLLEVAESEDISWFQKLKEYPGAASISMLKRYLNYYQQVNGIDISNIDFSCLSPDFSKHLYQLARYYDAYKIKRFKPAKRYALVVVFLYESKKAIADYLIQLHDQYISDICRECRNEHFKKLKLYKQRNEKAINKIK